MTNSSTPQDPGAVAQHDTDRSESAPDLGATGDYSSLHQSESPPNFGESYDRIQKLTAQERAFLVRRGTDRLEKLSQEAKPNSEEVADALVESTRDATLSNRATILEAVRMGNEQAKQYTEEIVRETEQMVRATIELVGTQVLSDELIDEMVHRSNGTVVQHMARVFLQGLDFLLYYNRLVIVKGIGNHIRIKFSKKYKSYYQRLLPHIHEDHLTLERVFMGGVKSLDEPTISNFAVGFLVHDVGKANDIEYHEGEHGYDRDTVERHVKLGFQAVMQKTGYPREAALITGYHHEYYGDPHGYGYFRDMLALYRQANPDVSADFVMSYSMEPLIDYKVISYFPAKILEIVDVFDSVTDKNRRYRRPLSAAEAVKMMKAEFITSHAKLDPILFDLFQAFLVERGRISAADVA